MKKIKYLFLILGLITSTNSKIFAHDFLTSTGSLAGNNTEILLNKIHADYDIPDVSASVTKLPWRNNKCFLNSKEKYNTPILISAYCAVLINPLPGEGYNVGLASNNIKGIVLKPSALFSQNSAIGPYTKSRGYKDGASYSDGHIIMTEGGGVCKIATTLYNLAVLANLKIVERHNHSMPINYVPYGQDATVSYGIKDFKFENSTDGNILIWSQMIDNRLYMAFYGNEKPPEISWSHETTDIVQPPTRYIKNKNLKKGEMKTILKGLNGARVKSHITIAYPDGRLIYKNMGISNYTPLPKLIEIN